MIKSTVTVRRKNPSPRSPRTLDTDPVPNVAPLPKGELIWNVVIPGIIARWPTGLRQYYLL